MIKKKNKIKRFSGRRHAWIIIYGVILLLAYIYIAGEFGLLQHWRLRQTKISLEKKIVQLRLQQDSLQTAIERLKADSSYMAKIAREKYNMGLPDEEIIRIINDKQ